ncbi:phosphatase PAP2 family protein [Mycobacterium sp. SM1]|uniref:phosphatase PAP2 family protein n=1 Tax=Mycobacterium sp. SM1 TaxID=2816243 RepID=UPI001F351DB4|nr:phosphatase PAP2 family protein [Mycobacterium sp. SM1]
MTLLRRVALAAWAGVVAYRTMTTGVAFNRELLLVYIATGLMTASIGRPRQVRHVLMVIRDWLPFALVLGLYDLSRGAASLVGTPTLWRFQPAADRRLFFGAVPTVWLQERLKMPTPPLWEVITSTVYMSFFIVPYAVAGLLWLRDRNEWKAFVWRFVSLSFAALVVYIVLPAAPPWAAARCTVAEVTGGPASPPCMFARPANVPGGGLLGAMRLHRPGAHQFVERISTRGWGTLHLRAAAALIDSGQASVNLVAAIPSLHAGLSAMVGMFLWRRIHWRWRPFLLAYALTMAFALVYSAEHYVIDILFGWMLAAGVMVVVGYAESRWSRRAGRPSARDVADSGVPSKRERASRFHTGALPGAYPPPVAPCRRVGGEPVRVTSRHPPPAAPRDDAVTGGRT